VQLLAHPLRFLPSGRAATTDADTDEYDQQLLTALIRTTTGERALTPGFGITDPVYSYIEPTEIAAGITTYGPDIDLQSVTAQPGDPGTSLVTITYA
jgi:hypothetical protein